MRKKKKLSEILPEDNGILASINASFPLNFFDDETEEGRARIAAMDYDYIWSNSGEKIASLMARKQYDEETKTLDMTKLVRILGMRYANKWNLMWEALTVEYDILENYNRTETEGIEKEGEAYDDVEEEETTSIDDVELDTGTITDVLDGEENDTGTITDVLDGETNDTGTDTLSIDSEITREEDETSNGSIYGFNSSNASDADKDVREYDESTIEERTDTRTLNLKTERDDETTRTLNTKREIDNENTRTLNTRNTKDRDISSGKTSSKTGRTVEEITRRLTIAGNIGVMSNEQMQEQRLLLLNKWFEFYHDVIYRDLDKILALSIY